jgi:predicted small secreted protein
MRKSPFILSAVVALGLSSLVAACNTTGGSTSGYDLNSGSSTESQANPGAANGISKGVGDTGNVHTNWSSTLMVVPVGQWSTNDHPDFKNSRQ